MNTPSGRFYASVFDVSAADDQPLLRCLELRQHYESWGDLLDWLRVEMRNPSVGCVGNVGVIVIVNQYQPFLLRMEDIYSGGKYETINYDY